jgi:hypothetical protein
MLVVSLDCLSPVSGVPNVGCVSGLSQSCVLCTQCWLCPWIVSDLCLVYPMLAVLGTQDTGLRQSRDTANIGYTRHRSETIQRHNQHWVHKTETIQRHSQHWVHKTILAVSLDFLSPVSCVPNVGGVSGLSQSCVLCTQCWLCLWIVSALGTQDTGLRQSRDTTNIGYTRHRSETIQRHNQHWVHKTQD